MQQYFSYIVAVSFIVYDGGIRRKPPKSVDVYIYIYFLCFLSDIVNVYTLIKYALYSIKRITWNYYSNKIKSLKLINSSFKTNLCITMVWQVGERVKITYSLNKYGFCHRNVRIEKSRKYVDCRTLEFLLFLYYLRDHHSTLFDPLSFSYFWFLFILIFFDIKRFSYISFQIFSLDFTLEYIFLFIFNIFFSCAGIFFFSWILKPNFG